MKRSRDSEEIARYLADESHMPGGRADEVVWPEGPAEVGEALAAAAADGHVVTVSGAGTGITGGRIPFGGTVLSTERLSRIHGIERVAVPAAGAAAGHAAVVATMRVGAGVPLATVQEAAAAEGLWYPPDPTENGAFVGGTLATNASGARSFRFGSSRAWARRIVVALADGAVVDLPRGRVLARDGRFELPLADGTTRVIPAPDWAAPHTTKHASGYYSAPGMDLVDLFIGSEGTLGVIVETELALIAAPEAMLSGILFFDGERAALEFVGAARGDRKHGEEGVTPIALEFFDRHALDIVRDKGAPVPAAAVAAIFFEQPVHKGDDFDARLEAWATLAETRGARADSWLAQEPEEQARFREFRHAVPWTINEAIARRGVRKVSTDTAVPEGRALELLETYRAILAPAGLESAAFGHIGDDHLHVNVLPKNADELVVAKELYARMVEAAVRMGGTISAEHGLGKLKAGSLGLLYAPPVLARMQAIKDALDPDHRLGRGTLFTD